MSKCLLRSVALYRGAVVYRPPTMGLSDVAGTGRGFTATRLDSVFFSLMQSLDIPFTVAWPTGMLSKTPAGITLAAPSRTIPLFQHLQPVIPVLLDSYRVAVLEQKTVIKYVNSKIRRTGLGSCFDTFIFKENRNEKTIGSADVFVSGVTAAG